MSLKKEMNAKTHLKKIKLPEQYVKFIEKKALDLNINKPDMYGFLLFHICNHWKVLNIDRIITDGRR